MTQILALALAPLNNGITQIVQNQNLSDLRNFYFCEKQS